MINQSLSHLANHRKLGAGGTLWDAQQDVFIYDLARGDHDRLSLDPHNDFNPRWTADGRKVVFSSVRQGKIDLYIKPSLPTAAGSLTRQTNSDGLKYMSYLFRVRGPAARYLPWVDASRGGPANVTNFSIFRTKPHPL